MGLLREDVTVMELEIIFPADPSGAHLKVEGCRVPEYLAGQFGKV